MDIREQLRWEISRNRKLLDESKEDPVVLAPWKRMVGNAELAADGNDKQLMQFWITTLQTYQG